MYPPSPSAPHTAHMKGPSQKMECRSPPNGLPPPVGFLGRALCAWCHSGAHKPGVKVTFAVANRPFPFRCPAAIQPSTAAVVLHRARHSKGWHGRRARVARGLPFGCYKRSCVPRGNERHPLRKMHKPDLAPQNCTASNGLERGYWAAPLPNHALARPGRNVWHSLPQIQKQHTDYPPEPHQRTVSGPKAGPVFWDPYPSCFQKRYHSSC
mmetsp:Transcript_26226/g.53457  ORF Transcript_26226/g.53457 Transcript_26226/m.53457 type:complete len:210 (+) Transcript_26226:211-840(+)